VIGEEYRRLRQAKMEARASISTPPRDPYHGRSMEPKLSRDPPRESFNLMVVGESGLGKTTLLESFFKSFKDDDATFALFERKETHSVIETRRQIEEASARRTVCERDIRVHAEKGQYTEANKAQQESQQLGEQIERLSERIKELCASDERRREELHALRETARTLRMDMKRAADQQDFPLAAEKQLLAEVVQGECDVLQAELKKMRRRESSKSTPAKGGRASPLHAAEEEGEEEGEGGRLRKGDAINAATVRVTPFDPFSISVGKHELQVTLVDTPGYGEFVNTEESFEVIARHVGGWLNVASPLLSSTPLCLGTAPHLPGPSERSGRSYAP
jgi:GTPase SAR1 family protein